jgi:hypothetical protein
LKIFLAEGDEVNYSLRRDSLLDTLIVIRWGPSPNDQVPACLFRLHASWKNEGVDVGGCVHAINADNGVRIVDR